VIPDLEIDESESVDRPLKTMHHLPSLQIFTDSFLSI